MAASMVRFAGAVVLYATGEADYRRNQALLYGGWMDRSEGDREDADAQAPPCRRCHGTGVDPRYHRRFTTGGHDERTCRGCAGTGERRAG